MFVDHTATKPSRSEIWDRIVYNDARKASEMTEAELKHMIAAVDEAITQVQAKLAALHKELDNAATMEEAIQIARKIRTANEYSSLMVRGWNFI